MFDKATAIQQKAYSFNTVGFGAGDGNRTHVASLEGWSVTITQHLHI